MINQGHSLVFFPRLENKGLTLPRLLIHIPILIFLQSRGTSPNDAIPIKSPLERLANSVTSPEKPTVRTAIQKDSPRRKQIDDDQTPPKHLKRSFQNVTVVSRKSQLFCSDPCVKHEEMQNV